jgi:hypothetical protein
VSASGGGGNGGSQSAPGAGTGGQPNTSASGSPASGQPGNVPATLTMQPVPAPPVDSSGGTDTTAFAIAIGVVLAAGVAIWWYRRRYPETLVQRPPGAARGLVNRS